MKDLGTPNIDFTRFFNTPTVHEINGKKVDAQSLMDNLCMVSIKIDSDTFEHVRYLTTEGLSKDQRLEYVQNLSQEFGSDVFEFSTCNRVLYVGFSSDVDHLERSVLRSTGLDNAPFEKFTGTGVWRHLVKVCSGLDSFIMGELQVMSQFRGAISWHRKNELLTDMNSSFFEHVVAGNRIVRKRFGFNKTTESMFNLATSAISDVLSHSPSNGIVVLGFGEMGRKASQTLVSLDQTDITVVSRNPQKSMNREVEGAQHLRFISFEEWHKSPLDATLVISTVRNTEPMYDADTRLPIERQTTVMDFSWPPSIDIEALHEGQVLLGMEHWIRAAHSLGLEWDYQSTIEQSTLLIQQVEEKFMSALTDRSNAKFRSYMYTSMENLSKSWNDGSSSDDSITQQYGPFSREIATWICNRNGPFSVEELVNMVHSTQRPFDTTLLKRVATDVTESILRMNQQETLSEAGH